MPVDGFPREMPLEGDTRSQPYIPIRAAMALVKIACSICPFEDLEQCRGAIDWIMGRKKFGIEPFPVLLAFTPGINTDIVSRAGLLRRKGDGPEPYLWCLVQFRGFRLQVYVPSCPADRHWFREDSPSNFTLAHFPSPFGPNWPAGTTTYGILDWSGTEPIRTAMNPIFQITGLIGITRPVEDPAATTI
jgi:hypothetical protein